MVVINLLEHFIEILKSNSRMAVLFYELDMNTVKMKNNT